MLWLALHFPLLPLEVLPLRQSPSAVIARGRVLVGDAQAEAAGVRAGQKLSTALGLAPGLAVFERDQSREQQALEQLACWVGRFTPTVCLVPPEELLLEIGGCLRLFGGIEAIAAAVVAGCVGQAYTPGWAVAPTPLGARWLAHQGKGAVLPEQAGMQTALADLSCELSGWSATVLDRLESFGMRRLGDLRQVPAAGLRRRIGNAAVDDLLRAWGDLPDPQNPFIFPEHFELKLELPSRVEHAEALLFAGQRLFASLSGWLQVRQQLARQCRLILMHDDGPPSELVLRFAEPSADEARFIRLLREHLGRLRLAAPVEALCLQADELVERPGDSIPLFDHPPAGEGASACLERLRARLGEKAVRALAQVADHRPECATREHDPDFNFGQNFGLTVAKTAPRPLWLLPTPQALVERSGSPHWHGPLKLMTRSERLESGWWDEGERRATGDVRRDYFVARNPLGQWAWVFRDAEGWFLHGLFA